MSYCRWSSDDYKSDVYCYESVYGGFDTHVAGRRHVPKESLPPKVSFDDIGAWMERHQEVSRIIGEADLVDIGLEFDGETFHDENAEGARNTLLMLRKAGYNVPDYAIEALEEEMDAQEENEEVSLVQG